MLDYKDIAKIFEEIELRLVASLKRNLSRHKTEEQKEGFEWSAWQAEKLRNIDRFRRENLNIVNEYVDVIDSGTRQLMTEQFREGEQIAEAEVNESEPTMESAPVQPPKPPTSISDEHFFGVNTPKMEKLMEDITTLEKTVETAAVRNMDDVYRTTLNKVQIAMGNGSVTLTEAVDLATREFLDKGINCIVYADGRRVNIADYVRMALRTTSTRATLQGKAKRFAELGYDTVLVSQYGGCSETCEPYQGKVYIDDVFTIWNGEKSGDFGKSNYCGKWFMLLSVAIRGGLFHPNCRHTMSQYIDGRTKVPEPIPAEKIKQQRELEQKQRAMERRIRALKRKVEGTQNEKKVKEYKHKLREAQKELKEFVNEHKDVLHRDYSREKTYSSGVINENEKSSRRNNPTSINFDIINSPEYKEKFKGISDNSETDSLICEKARDMLKHRNNTYYEDMYLFDSEAKTVVGVQTHSEIPNEVVYNDSLNRAVKNSKPYTLISLHNHPESKPPSGSDFCSCGFRKYQKGVVCCHNGDVYLYQTGDKAFSSTLFDNTVDKYVKRGYNEKEAYRITLKQFERDYNIKWEMR